MEKKSLLAAAFLSTAALFGAALDKGGVTFDFKKSSAELFKPAAPVAQADNLISNADGTFKESPKDPLRWQGNYCYLHTKEISDKDPRRTQVRKMVKWTIKDGVFTVIKPEGLNKILPLTILKNTSGG